MLPTPAIMVWSIRMPPTGFLLTCTFSHSASASASSRSGSCPSRNLAAS